MFLVSFSSRTRKITLEHLLNGPIRTKFENRKNAEINGNSVKMAVFDLQNAQTRAFLKISRIHLIGLYQVYTYTPDRALSGVSFFLSGVSRIHLKEHYQVYTYTPDRALSHIFRFIQI